MNIRKDDLVSFSAFTLTLFSRQAVKHFRSTLIIHHISLSFSPCVSVPNISGWKPKKENKEDLPKFATKGQQCVTLLTLHFRYRQRNYYYKDLIQDKFQKRLRMTVSYFVSRSRKWTQTKKKRVKKKILNDDDDEITRDEILFCWLLPLSLVSLF